MRVRGLKFKDEDEAFEHFRQREIDDMDFTFDEETHTYKLGGMRVPSVTEIIAPLSDHSRVPQETLEYKRSLGKAVHKAIEYWENGVFDLYEHDPMILPYFEGWLKFKKESGFRAMWCEKPVASTKLRIAGTPDVGGSRSPTANIADELLDVKCVYAIDPATGVQLAGYDIIGRDFNKGWNIKTRGAVQLIGDGTFRYHLFNNPNDAHVFRACAAIYSWKALSK